MSFPLSDHLNPDVWKRLQFLFKGKRTRIDTIYLVEPSRRCRFEYAHNILIAQASTIVNIKGRFCLPPNQKYYSSLYLCLGCFKRMIIGRTDYGTKRRKEYKTLPEEVLSSIVDLMPKLPDKISASILTEHLKRIKK